MSPVATRISLGAVMVAVFGAILLADIPISAWAGRGILPGFWLITLAAPLIGGWELLRMLRRSGRPCHPVIALVFIALLIGSAWAEPSGCPVYAWMAGHGLPVHLLLIVATLFATFIVEIVRTQREGHEMGQALAGVAWTMMVVLTVGLLAVFVVKIRYMGGDSLDGLLYLALLLGVAKISDIGAYAVGSAIGRHKLVPRLSPKKTVEGLVGGLAGGIGAAMAIGLGWGRFTWWQMLIFGAAVSASSILGDLAESLIKRACEVKDSGAIPGFGGVLDILDSILAAGPVAYVVLAILTGPKWGG